MVLCRPILSPSTPPSMLPSPEPSQPIAMDPASSLGSTPQSRAMAGVARAKISAQ